MSSLNDRMDVNESQAYHIALKTLRERCNYLQHKLEAVEEENCKLKLQISQDSISKSPRSNSEISVLQEEVALLTKEKSQLSQQVQMVATENHALWSRLSKLTAVNQNLGNRLSIITDTLNRHDGHLSKSINLRNLECKSVTPECSKESLEEISLKLINGILLGKTELENQYAQMVDLQNDNECMNIENYCFSIPLDDDSSILNNIKKHVQKLNQLKQSLYDQKNMLTSAISNLKGIQKNNICNKCLTNNNNTSNENVESVNGDETKVDGENPEELCNDLSTLRLNEMETDTKEESNSIPEKICPMCGVNFNGSYEDFMDHVSDHFGDEDEVTNTFELLP